MKKYLLLLILLCPFLFAGSIQQQHMAVIAKKNASGAPANTYQFFWDGECATEEDGDSTSGDCDLTGTLVGTDTNISTAQAYSGSTSMFINGAMGGDEYWYWTRSPSTTEAFVEFFIYISTANDEHQELVVWYYDAENYLRIFLDWTASTSRISITHEGANAINWFYGTQTIATGAWHKVQVRVDTTRSSSDDLSVRVCAEGADSWGCSGVSWEDETDALTAFATAPNRLSIGAITINDATGDYYIDDLKVWDTYDQS